MMLTEQANPRSQGIDQRSTLEMLQIINAEDQKVALAVAQALPQIAQAVDGIVEQMQKGGRLFYVGAGTSGRLGVLDAVECVPTYGTPPELVQGIIAGGEGAITHSIEGAEDDAQAGREILVAHGLTSNDAVVGIAASGRTPYALGAVGYAREIGALTIGIACNDPSPLLKGVDIPIGVVVGEEVIAGSTRMKAGTAQKLVLNMLSTAVMIKLGKVYDNLMVDVRASNEKLVIRARRLVERLTGVDEATASALLAQADNDVKTAVVMHRKGVDADAARELLAGAGGRLRAVIG